MDNKKFIGSFNTVEQAMAKVDELKAQGVSEGDIYALTTDDDNMSMLRGRADISVNGTDSDSWLDRFMAFLSGDDLVNDSFRRMGFSDDEATLYRTQCENGEILLFVDSDLGNAYTATGVYNNTVDTANGMNVHGAYTDGVNEEQRMQLHEERLNVDKERVQAGEVNVGKRVVAEQQSVEVPVAREEVYVERRAVSDERATGEVFNDGEEIHIPVMEERVEVTKRPVVNEELVVGKRQVQDYETVNETVRREEAEFDSTGDVTNEFGESTYNENQKFYQNQQDTDYGNQNQSRY